MAPGLLYYVLHTAYIETKASTQIIKMNYAYNNQNGNIETKVGNHCQNR